MQIDEDARRFADLHMRREEARLRYREIDDEYKIAKRDLGVQMLHVGLASIDAGDFEVKSKSTIMAKVPHQEAFVIWATQHDSNLLQVAPRRKELNEYVRYCVTHEQTLPPGVESSQTFRFRVTRR